MCSLAFIKLLACVFTALCVVLLFPIIRADCNENACATIVSKCLITESCKCAVTDWSCRERCMICLGGHYVECCGCLELCPVGNDTLNVIAPKSEIGDFEGVPELFESLTSDDNDEWTLVEVSAGSYDFLVNETVDENLLKYLAHKDNCTVIFFNTCLKNTKCEEFCESTGANSYRWFHDGCCECVGPKCLNYGINESLCSRCPNDDDELDFTEYGENADTNATTYEYDYGEHKEN